MGKSSPYQQAEHSGNGGRSAASVRAREQASSTVDAKPVAIVRYERPRESVEQAVELSQGLRGLKPGDRVFVKPNICH